MLTMNGGGKSHNLKIEFNVDDMNPQLIPDLIEKVMDAGAADAYVIPIIMKKGRPGFLFTITCSNLNEEKIVETVFSNSTTIGVRKINTEGVMLKCRVSKTETSFGQVQIKEIILPGGNKKVVPEYEWCKIIAARENLPVKEVQETLLSELNNHNDMKKVYIN